MSLQVNFTTHGHDLKATYESILRPADPKTSNNWAMFGYDKGTNDLKVLGQGDGGLEELEDEFMDGKIQYAFARIIDPNTELNKFILIAWVTSLFSSSLFSTTRVSRKYTSFLLTGPIAFVNSAAMVCQSLRRVCSTLTWLTCPTS